MGRKVSAGASAVTKSIAVCFLNLGSRYLGKKLQKKNFTAG